MVPEAVAIPMTTSAAVTGAMLIATPPNPPLNPSPISDAQLVK